MKPALVVFVVYLWVMMIERVVVVWMWMWTDRQTDRQTQGKERVLSLSLSPWVWCARVIGSGQHRPSPGYYSLIFSRKQQNKRIMRLFIQGRENHFFSLQPTPLCPSMHRMEAMPFAQCFVVCAHIDPFPLSLPLSLTVCVCVCMC